MAGCVRVSTFFLGCAGTSCEEDASSERGASVSRGRSRDCEGELGASAWRMGAGCAGALLIWPHRSPSVSSSLRPLRTMPTFLACAPFAVQNACHCCKLGAMAGQSSGRRVSTVMIPCLLDCLPPSLPAYKDDHGYLKPP